MIGGGFDESWFEELTPEGNKPIDSLNETLGCHTGSHIGLNLENPQPGFEYQWCLNPARPGGGHGDHLFIQSIGGQIVLDTDAEYAHYNSLYGEKSMDSIQQYRELVLVRITEDAARERREAVAEKSRRKLQMSGSGFLDGAGGDELAQGSNDGGGATRFSRRDHNTRLQSHGPNGPEPTEVWTPGDGITSRNR